MRIVYFDTGRMLSGLWVLSCDLGTHRQWEGMQDVIKGSITDRAWKRKRNKSLLRTGQRFGPSPYRLRETSGLGVMEHKIDHRLSIVNKLSFSESDCARSYINITEAGQPPHPVPYQSKNYRLSLPSWYQVSIC